MNNTEAKYQELIREVAEMRRLQKEFFSARSSIILKKAKEAESRVDALINALDSNKTQPQQNLFTQQHG